MSTSRQQHRRNNVLHVYQLIRTLLARKPGTVVSQLDLKDVSQAEHNFRSPDPIYKLIALNNSRSNWSQTGSIDSRKDNAAKNNTSSCGILRMGAPTSERLCSPSENFSS